MTYFGKHNVSETLHVIAGADFTTVDIPFIPDYIKVEFVGGSTANPEAVGEDNVYWSIAPLTPTSYQLSIGWEIYSETRHIYYRASRLNVDPV